MATKKFLLSAPRWDAKIIQDLQVHLADNLTWLTTAYGKAKTLKMATNDGEIRYPAVFDTISSYQSVTPHENDGNTVFFTCTKSTRERNQGGRFEISAIFFLKVDEVNTPDYAVESAILQILSFAKHGIGEKISVYEKFSDVFEGFDLNETENFETMHPYHVFKLSFEVISTTINTDCL